MRANYIKHLCLGMVALLSASVMAAGENESLARAKEAAGQIASGTAPKLYLVLVQDSATEPAYAGAIAEFDVSRSDGRLERALEQGKTKWNFIAATQVGGGALRLKGRFEGWIDVGSERRISQRAGVGGGLGYSGEIKARLKVGEPLLLTSNEVHNVPGDSAFSETLSLFLVWK